MNANHRTQLSLGLMGSSLLLLGGFLGYWLYDTYQQEYAQLQKESHLLFVSSAQDVEDRLLQRVFVEGVYIGEQQDPSQSMWLKEKSPNQAPLDILLGEQSKQGQALWLESDSNQGQFPVSIEIKANDNGSKDLTVCFPEGKDSSMGDQEIFTILAMLGDSSKEILPPINPGHARFFFSDTFADEPQALLQNEFLRKLSPEQQRVGIRIIDQSDSQFSYSNISDQFYRNPISGRGLAVDLGEYRTYILGQIWPQILFSFILFVSISLAFYLVYRSLVKQRRLATLKDNFVSNITHELKTPITTVSVAIEALRNFQALNDPAKTEEYLDISQNELNRLSILVDRVLRMSRFEHGAPELNKESLDVQELLDTVLNSFKLRFEQSGAEVKVDHHGDHFQIQADKAHLSSVLYNLIDNALKYSPDSPQLNLKIWEEKQQVCLQIADQGLGIDPEYQKKVFEKFFRVPTGNRHNVKGHGLGLSYVADVVHQHGGGIHLESQPGQGTTITIRLDRA